MRLKSFIIVALLLANLPCVIAQVPLSLSNQQRKPNSEHCAFVTSFPADYSGFLNSYDYEKPLYDVYPEHLKFLCETESECKSEVIQLLINIAKDAKWEADAINLLQGYTLQHIELYPDISMHYIAMLTKKEIESLWYFLFSGPCPEDSQNRRRFQTIYQAIKHGYPIEAELLMQQYELVKRDNRE